MKTKPIVYTVVLSLLACCALGAENEKKPLVNSNVVHMVKAGLGETVIINAIQSNPASYDLSPEALIELNKQGVSAKLQEAMQGAMQRAPQATPASTPNTVSPGATQAQHFATAMSGMNSVFLINGTQRVELKQNKGDIDSTIAPFVAKSKWVFEGKEAQFRLTNDSPVFEVALMANVIASDHVTLTKPTIKKDKREILIMGAAGPFATKIKPDKKALVPLIFEEVKKEGFAGAQVAIHRVKPEKSLPAGEYVLTVNHVFYCFGVDKAK